MTAIGRRGGSPITESDLRAHLAAVICMEKVAFFTGAGTSKCAGGGLVREIWASFEKAEESTVEWLRDENFLENGTQTGLVNLEALLDSLGIAEADLHRRSDTTGLQQIRSAKRSIVREVVRAAMLHNDLWTAQGRVKHAASKLGGHRDLLARLSSSRAPGQDPPWIFTVNYDLAFEWAAELLQLNVTNGFTGLHDRVFSSSSFDLGFQKTTARGSARFGSYSVNLVKLHGSLSWRNPSWSLLPVEEQSELTYTRLQGIVDPSNQNAGAAQLPIGDLTEQVMILPGANKYVETAGFVYGELLRRFAEFLSRPEAVLLVAGYSFSDAHLNRIILSSLQNPTMQIVVFSGDLTQEQVVVGDLSELPTVPRDAIGRLFGANSPRITLIGSPISFFPNLVTCFPEPVLIDGMAQERNRASRLLDREPDDIGAPG